MKSIQNLSGQGMEKAVTASEPQIGIQAAELIHSFMPAGPSDWAFIIRTILSPSVYERAAVQAPRFYYN